MALEVTLNKKKLIDWCERLGLTPESSDKYKDGSKDFYAYAIRNHMLAQTYPNGIPRDLELMLQLETPMVCARIADCKEDLQKDIWDSDKFVFEEKIDGNRMVDMFLKDIGMKNYSRNLSEKNLLPIEYSSNIYTECDFNKLQNEFILDSEIICLNPNISTILGSRGCVTETTLQATTALLSMNSEDSIEIQRDENAPLKFYTFDCIYYNGEWLIDKPYMERRKYLKLALAELEFIGLKAEKPRTNISKKRAFYKQLINGGLEGCIAKRLDSPYIPSSSRAHRQWVKLKRSMSESLQDAGAGDTIDAFISGYEEADKDKQFAGYVGALKFSCYLTDEQGNRKIHHIATISAFSMELRKDMTEWNDEGVPRLKLEYYNKVVEIDGQAVSARARRLRHAKIITFRPDKNPEQCDISEAFLNSMIL